MGMDLRFFDTHCHLAGDELIPHAEDISGRAWDGHVRGWAIVAADIASLKATPDVVARLKAKHPQAVVVGTAGLHPHESETIDPAGWALVEAQASSSAAAVGETGLDYFYDHSDRAIQREWFDKHIELACQLKKPLVIHCRNAAADVLSMLDRPSIRNHPNPGILHCFTEDAPTAKALLDLNFYISLSGIISFRNAEALREVAKMVPAERLLIETDSPWLAPIPHRGKRNEPAFVKHVFETLCTVRSESPEQLAPILWENSCRVYGVKAS